MIADELKAEFTDAMKTKDAARRDVIRQVNAEIALRKAEPGFDGDLSDDVYREVIGSYVKKMDKARREYEDLGERGAGMAAKLAYEVEYLSRWLPSKLGENETRALVDATIADLGVAGDPKATGRVIGMLMKDHKDELDGALANRLVREALGA
jgi:uncharacterized protein YqeY